MRNVINYLRQPSSVAGLSALVGTLIGMLSGNLSWQAAMPLLVGGLVAVILPDNSLAKASAITLAKDAIALEQAIVSSNDNKTS